MATASKDKKKYAGGPSRKSYLRNLATGGGGKYSEYGDWDEGDVNKQTKIQHRSSVYSAATMTPQAWAEKLVQYSGLSTGDPFKHKGRIYTVRTGRGGTTADESKI